MTREKREQMQYDAGFKSGMDHGAFIKFVPEGGKFLLLENVRKAKEFKDSNPYWLGYYEALEKIRTVEDFV